MSNYKPPGQYKKPPGRLLSTDEAAAYLGVSRRTVFNLRKIGKLKAIVITDRIVRFDKSELDDLIRQSKASASA
ncbi:helix-turn-helix transcriptional regulator [Mycobacterium intracellulare]|uniref:helix-turn-helix transcriptional regulator n=1 Tax=Mycobacterium intracellulare TaxID=1767 RepID=UPI001916C378|nr:helix-turn-helix domain-containing protein [Mycobacterium intracellulare]